MSSKTISSQPPTQAGMDFARLRQEGLRYIQKLAGDRWSDHNLHDPGITILEQLCYAVTDLCYRLDFAMTDLLAEPGGNANTQFFTAGRILTSHPLTVNDYRKLLIDTPGVKNAWLKKCDNTQPELYYDPVAYRLGSEAGLNTGKIRLNGLYTVLIEKSATGKMSDEQLITAVNVRLNRYRNLCEDFEQIIVLPNEEITVTARISIAEHLDADELMARMYFHIDKFISPSIRFYSLDEMMQRGRAVEEIFNGPWLQNGFVDDDELAKLDQKSQLYVSDLIHIMLDLDGIKAVEDITVASKLLPKAQKWALELDPYRAPLLKPVRRMLEDGDIRFYKGDIPCVFSPDRICSKLDLLKQASAENSSQREKTDLESTWGEYRNLADYVSLQYEFPANYGIGYLGLPSTVSETRKAQAKQLQAYLLFYDQILTNYFNQLDHVKDLFSLSQPQHQTYFAQALVDAPGLEEIITADGATLQGLAEDETIYYGRKNRMLDHLLARFCETFTDYSLMLYQEVSESFIRDKAAFLAQYPELSARRGAAADYLDAVGRPDNVSGLQKRIYGLLGIQASEKQNLAGWQAEGFYLVEHILLRPGGTFGLDLSKLAKDDQGRPVQIPPLYSDPYSFQLTFILPDGAGRFADENFKALTQRIILAETPAHIIPKVKWVNQEEMERFETLYPNWLAAKAGRQAAEAELSDNLIEFLGIGTPVSSDQTTSSSNQ